MAKRTMKELFETMPELTYGFEDDCKSYASPIPIFYRRKGKKAECTCGRCGYEFTREDKPERYVKTSCKVCGREGLYEWKRVILPKTEYYTVVIIQKRTDGNLVARHFRCINTYQQGVRQNFSCIEFCRQFYDMGDYYKFNWMREELGYDMSNPVFLFPKNLQEKHDEMVSETQALKDALIEVQKNEKYAEIKNKFEKLNLKYGYEAAGLLIRPAKYAAEILAEGRTLHHCVGRDAYMEKHNNGKTFILFLRRSEEPDKPYYTIEIKDKGIIQWYGLHDKKPDIETVGPWLNEYILHLGGTQAVYVAQEVKPA